MANADLLVLQEHDTRIDQIEHRLAVLPERHALEELDASGAALDGEIDRADRERADLDAEQARLDRDLEATTARLRDLDRKLATGTVPRELQALSDERSQYLARQDELEDALLVVLDGQESVGERLATLRADREALEGRRAVAAENLAAAEGVIGAELAAERAARDAVAAEVAAPLLQEYERLRAHLGGVAAAPLTGSSCGGCHLRLAAVDVDRFRSLPADAIVHCEQCGRILVRA